MSNNSFTLAALQERSFRKYGRGADRSELVEIWPEELASIIARLTNDYPFWFFVQKPGTIVPGLFPFATPTTYTEFAESCWIDIGWFHSIQGQISYPFSTVLNPSQVTDASRWRRVYVEQIDTIFEFQVQGGYPRQLQVLDPDHFLRQTRYSTTQGEPTCCMLSTVNEQSFIQFDIAPDTNQYIYAVRFMLKTFPPFLSPHDTNALFRYHSDFVVDAGCMILAEYYRDWDMLTHYENKLKGAVDPATGRRSPGMVDELKAETRKQRGQSADDVVEHYLAPPYDNRRSWSTSPTGGFYPDWPTLY